MNAIFKRRSIRRYTDQTIKEEQIRKILEAGMCAPSAGNNRPWHFIVVTETEKRQHLSKISDYAGMLAQAPLGIVVCAQPTIERYHNYWPVDCSAATQNILLQVTDMGLGAVWLGVYPREHRMTYIRDYFGLSDDIYPLALIAIGHPAEEKAPKQCYDESRVHRENW